MNALVEIGTLAKRLFSANRRKKMMILAKEWKHRSVFFSRSHLVGIENLPVDPDADTWSSHESRSIDVSYFQMDTSAKIEDHVGEDGLIHAKQDYVVRKIYGATSYTNESTHRSIFNRAGELVEPLSYQRSGTRAPQSLRLPVTRSIKGTTANLYGNVASAEGNYLHWFVDSMSRLFLIKRFHNLDDIDYVLVPPLKYDFHWDSLAALGFDRSRIIELDPLECLQFECLLASSPPRGKGSAICPGWIIDCYKETLLQKASSIQSVAGKKVYISRRDAPNRMFSNEEEVCDFFEALGFNVVELTPLNLWEKIAVFRDAELVVSQSGAGLTNLLFCKSGLRVLELVDKSFVYPLWASFVAYCGGKHHAHFFSDESNVARSNAMTSKSYLDIEELKNALSDFKLLSNV